MEPLPLTFPKTPKMHTQHSLKLGFAIRQFPFTQTSIDSDVASHTATNRQSISSAVSCLHRFSTRKLCTLQNTADHQLWQLIFSSVQAQPRVLYFSHAVVRCLFSPGHHCNASLSSGQSDLSLL